MGNERLMEDAGFETIGMPTESSEISFIVPTLSPEDVASVETSTTRRKIPFAAIAGRQGYEVEGIFIGFETDEAKQRLNEAEWVYTSGELRFSEKSDRENTMEGQYRLAEISFDGTPETVMQLSGAIVNGISPHLLPEPDKYDEVPITLICRTTVHLNNRVRPRRKKLKD